MSAALTIRKAAATDAEGILRAHHSAVHQMACRDYPPEILLEWSSPVTADRIQRYIECSLPEETTFVAVLNGTIAGFGAIVEAQNELRALYISAQFGRMGVGSSLLHALEQCALEHGCSFLQLDASLTAESFYKVHGFEVIERGEHALRSGRKMACVKMKKTLKASQT